MMAEEGLSRLFGFTPPTCLHPLASRAPLTEGSVYSLAVPSHPPCRGAWKGLWLVALYPVTFTPCSALTRSWLPLKERLCSCNQASACILLSKSILFLLLGPWFTSLPSTVFPPRWQLLCPQIILKTGILSLKPTPWGRAPIICCCLPSSLASACQGLVPASPHHALPRPSSPVPRRLRSAWSRDCKVTAPG